MSKLLYTAKDFVRDFKPGEVVQIYKMRTPLASDLVPESVKGKKYQYYIVKDNKPSEGLYASKKWIKQNFEPMREVQPFDFKPLIFAFVLGILSEVVKDKSSK